MTGRRHWLAAVLLAAACGSDNGPNTGLDEADLFGKWTMEMAPNPSCMPGGGGTITFAIDGSQVSEAGGDVRNLVTAWQFGTVTGTADLGAGQMNLLIWRSTLDTGASLSGTFTATGTFTGTLRDPAPGFDPAFVIGSCTFQVSGTRQ
jgi:hypothetical protein